ncbi:hypothetical protein L596_026391 [Steinernema carpocapsae]|uniref:CUB domain-containing protein n=2 Tax=Steinernema carpocapsae TaxID=34508 RepID=A0A4U5M181_STECR|nr:hypothetical protein L596_026391 [Steinernema carpocapsae]
MLLRFLLLLALAVTPWTKAALTQLRCSGMDKPLVRNLGLREAVIIRSYDWPNSVVTEKGQLRHGNCSMHFTTIPNQKLALVFLNAHVAVNINGNKSIVDTNSKNKVQRFISEQPLNFSIETPDRSMEKLWNGFEAIVMFLGERSACPFQTGRNWFQPPTIIKDNQSLFVTSFNDLDPKRASTSTSERCSWKFVSQKGTNLKLVFPVFTLGGKGASVSVNVDQLGWVTLSNITGLPPRFYAEKSLDIFYERNGKRDPSQGYFFGVVSSLDNTVSACPQGDLWNLTESRPISNKRINKKKQFWMPYGNGQHCEWNITTAKQKELRFYIDYNQTDTEECCDWAFLKTFTGNAFTRVRNVTHVFAEEGGNNATVIWKSDQSYGRSGFWINVTVIDCSNAFKNFVLSNKHPKIVFGPSNGVDQPYCKNMTMRWTIRRPKSSFMILTIHGQLRGCESNKPLGDQLKIESFNASSCTLHKQYFISSKSTAVTFISANKWPKLIKDDSYLNLKASYLNYSTLSNKHLTLDGSSDYLVFHTSILNTKFANQTFVSPDASKPLLIYPFTDVPTENVEFLLIDGELNENTTFTRWRLGDDMEADEVKPFKSKTGMVTILQIKDYATLFPTLLLKVFDSKTLNDVVNFTKPVLEKFKNLRTLNALTDFAIFDTINLVGKQSDQTFALGPDLKSKQLQIYPVWNNGSLPFDDFLMIDGDLNNGKLLKWTFENSSAPYLSETGVVTIIRISQNSTAFPTLLVKVYDETQDCDPSNPLIAVTKETESFAAFSSYNASSCPIKRNPPQPLNSSLSAPDQEKSKYFRVSTPPVRHCSTSRKYKVEAFLTVTFSSKTASTWNPVLSGKVFTILVPANGSCKFEASLHDLVQNETRQMKNEHDVLNGVFMSPSYPFGSSGTNLSIEILKLLPVMSGKKPKLKGKFSILVEKFMGKSSLEIRSGSKILQSYDKTSNGKPMTYEVKRADEITMKYSGSYKEKGFFVRYELEPASAGSISCLVTLALGTMYHLL